MTLYRLDQDDQSLTTHFGTPNGQVSLALHVIENDAVLAEEMQVAILDAKYAASLPASGRYLLPLSLVHDTQDGEVRARHWLPVVAGQVEATVLVAAM